jgi:hypothetical protein
MFLNYSIDRDKDVDCATANNYLARAALNELTQLSTEIMEDSTVFGQDGETIKILRGISNLSNGVTVVDISRKYYSV